MKGLLLQCERRRRASLTRGGCRFEAVLKPELRWPPLMTLDRWPRAGWLAAARWLGTWDAPTYGIRLLRATRGSRPPALPTTVRGPPPRAAHALRLRRRLYGALLRIASRLASRLLRASATSSCSPLVDALILAASFDGMAFTPS